MFTFWLVNEDRTVRYERVQREKCLQHVTIDHHVTLSSERVDSSASKSDLQSTKEAPPPPTSLRDCSFLELVRESESSFDSRMRRHSSDHDKRKQVNYMQNSTQLPRPLPTVSLSQHSESRSRLKRDGAVHSDCSGERKVSFNGFLRAPMVHCEGLAVKWRSVSLKSPRETRKTVSPGQVSPKICLIPIRVGGSPESGEHDRNGVEI